MTVLIFALFPREEENATERMTFGSVFEGLFCARTTVVKDRKNGCLLSFPLRHIECLTRNVLPACFFNEKVQTMEGIYRIDEIECVKYVFLFFFSSIWESDGKNMKNFDSRSIGLNAVIIMIVSIFHGLDLCYFFPLLLFYAFPFFLMNIVLSTYPIGFLLYLPLFYFDPPRLKHLTKLRANAYHKTLPPSADT